MRFALLVAGSVGTLALAFSATAHANVQTNGVQVNGVQVNGVQVNGVQVNGVQINGVQINGVQVNGVQINGVQINGSGITGYTTYSTCSHREDVVGGALSYGCSPCAKTVQNADPYCYLTAWDDVCVAEAKAMCRIGSTNLVGSQFTGTVRRADNTTTSVTLRIDGVRQTATGVLAHRVTYLVPSVCRYNPITRKVVCTTAYWAPICNSSAQDNPSDPNSIWYYNESLVAPGTWELREGYQAFTSPHNNQVYSGGGKVPGSVEAGNVTFACRDVGAVAKCIERTGYEPWRSAARDTLHQTCVRAIRGDFCGDGHSFTQDGTSINTYDYLQIERDTVFWHGEASWALEGAVCSSFDTRWPSDANGYPLNLWIKNQPLGGCAVHSISNPSLCVPGSGLANPEYVLGISSQVLLRTESKCLAGTDCYQ